MRIMTRRSQLISISTIVLSALSLSLAASGRKLSTQSETIHSKCPLVEVSCPTTDQPFIFTAGVYDVDSSEKISNLNVEYCWTLSKGKILYGQGTDSMTVDASSTDMGGLTATVDVRGLDSECKAKASCSTSSRSF